MKTITVTIPCQNVDSDGCPVNKNGIAYGPGWRSMVTSEKKRIVVSKFCPVDVKSGKRDAVLAAGTWEVLKCRCHKKMRLRAGEIANA